VRRLASLALLLAACAAPAPAPPGRGRLVVDNATAQAVVRLHLTPADEPVWSGGDRLGLEHLAPGRRRAWEVPAGRWHVRAELEGGTVLDGLEVYDVAPGGAATCVLAE
jgi:hypothetical protein